MEGMHLFLLTLTCAWSLWAGPSLLSKVQSTYDKTNSYKAHFKQSYWNKLFNRLETSEGELFYQKPGKMRWDYTKPRQKSFILNKNTLWLVEYEDKTVLLNKCFQSDAFTTSLVFLGGSGKLSKQFGLLRSARDDELELVPKKESSVLSKLILRIDPKTGRVSETTVIDPDGNKNQFEFSNAQFGVKFPKNQFDFKAPKDFEVGDMPGSCSR
jgi:outer membrane lipoprotein carrier protein